MEQGREIIRPQEGYQIKALSNPADIVIGGSSAGCGKTFGLLLEPLKHILKVKDFGGVIFRRTTPQIRNQGGLWDTSMSLYTKIPGTSPRETGLEWSFPCNDSYNTLKFAHLEYEKNIYDWQGSQIPFIGFDELTHFTETMFFYLLSRNRSICGVKPIVRATCNPDPESWVADFVSWWIDENSGYPVPEKNGVIRYFIKNSGTYIWGDSYNEVYEKAKFIIDEQVELSNGIITANNLIKSVSFVSGSIYDNKKLLEVNPEYLANLMSLDEDEKNKLLKGNWKVVLNSDQLYDYYKFQDMFNNLYSVKDSHKYLTVDIATEGSNVMPIMYWEGNSLEDIKIIPRNDGKQAVEEIKNFARIYRISNSNIIYDADGVGGGTTGWISGSIPFHGGSTVIPVLDPISRKMINENYFNLKTQLYYRSANGVNEGKYHISEKVANTMFNEKLTVKQRFNFERKAIKKLKADNDGKKRIISKLEMKSILGGESPDLMDCFSQREYFNLKPTGGYFKTSSKIDLSKRYDLRGYDRY